MNAIDRSFVTLFVNTPRLRPNSQFAKSNLFVLYCLQFGASSSNSMADSRGGAGVRPPKRGLGTIWQTVIQSVFITYYLRCSSFSNVYRLVSNHSPCNKSDWRNACYKPICWQPAACCIHVRLVQSCCMIASQLWLHNSIHQGVLEYSILSIFKNCPRHTIIQVYSVLLFYTNKHWKDTV